MDIEFDKMPDDYTAEVKKRMGISIQTALANTIPTNSRPSNYIETIEAEVEGVYTSLLKAELDRGNGNDTRITNLESKVATLESQVADLLIRMTAEEGHTHQ